MHVYVTEIYRILAIHTDVFKWKLVNRSVLGFWSTSVVVVAVTVAVVVAVVVVVVFSSPKPKVLRVSYCDRPLSVVRRA